MENLFFLTSLYRKNHGVSLEVDFFFFFFFLLLVSLIVWRAAHGGSRTLPTKVHNCPWGTAAPAPLSQGPTCSPGAFPCHSMQPYLSPQWYQPLAFWLFNPAGYWIPDLAGLKLFPLQLQPSQASSVPCQLMSAV